MNNVSVVLYNLPSTIRSFVKEDNDGYYTIVINARLNDLMRMKAYKHELRHIFNIDFEKSNVDKIECERHKED